MGFRPKGPCLFPLYHNGFEIFPERVLLFSFTCTFYKYIYTVHRHPPTNSEFPKVFSWSCIHRKSIKLLILLKLRAIYFRTLQYETPCKIFKISGKNSKKRNLEFVVGPCEHEKKNNLMEKLIFFRKDFNPTIPYLWGRCISMNKTLDWCLHRKS